MIKMANCVGKCCSKLASGFGLAKLIMNFFFSRRGSLLSTAIFVYAATAPVNGYSGGSLYARMGGELVLRMMIIDVPSVCALTLYVLSNGLFIAGSLLQ